MTYTRFLPHGLILGFLAIAAITHTPASSELTGQVTGVQSAAARPTLIMQAATSQFAPASAISTSAGRDEDVPSFARCTGYETLFPRTADVPDGKTLLDVWGETFTAEINRYTDMYVQEARDDERCLERVQAVTTRLVGIVQKYECALIELPNVGTSTAMLSAISDEDAASTDAQDTPNVADLLVSVGDLMNTMSVETVQVKQALNVSRNTLSYILESPVFQCSSTRVEIHQAAASTSLRPEL